MKFNHIFSVVNLIKELFCLFFVVWALNGWCQDQTHFMNKKSTEMNQNFELVMEITKKNLINDFSKLQKSSGHESEDYYRFLFQRARDKAKDILYIQNQTKNGGSTDNYTEFINSLKSEMSSLWAESGNDDQGAFFKKLEEKLIEIEAYQQLGLNNNINEDDVELDPLGFKVVMKTNDFQKLLQDHNEHMDDPRFAKIKNFYESLVEDESLLLQTPYSDSSDTSHDNSCETKKKDLAHVFNQITEFVNRGNGKLISFPGLDDGPYVSHYRGKSEQFKSELLFKLILIVESRLKEVSFSMNDKTFLSQLLSDPQYSLGKSEEFKRKLLEKLDLMIRSKNRYIVILSKQEKIFLIQQLLRAGRYCPVTKKQAISEQIFPLYCPDQTQALEESIYPKRDLYAQAYLLTSNLKRRLLDELLQEKIPDHLGESLGIRAATQDYLAPQIGLPQFEKVNSNLRDKKIEVKDFLLRYTPKELLQTYINHNASRYEEEAGLLRNFQGVNYKKYFALAELQRYGLLAPADFPGGEGEKKLRKEDPTLVDLRSTDPKSYAEKMVKEGISRGDHFLIHAYLRADLLSNYHGGVTHYLLNGKSETSGEISEQEGNILLLLMNFIQNTPQLREQEPSWMVRLLKAGLTNKIQFLVKNGFKLNAEDLKTLERQPNAKALSTLRELEMLLKLDPSFIPAVEERLAKGPFLPNGFEESFRTDPLISGGPKLIWSKPSKENVNWNEAQTPEKGCPPPSRLPSEAESKALGKKMKDLFGYNPVYFVPFFKHSPFAWNKYYVHQSFYNNYFWTSDLQSVNNSVAFNGSDGYPIGVYQGRLLKFRCVLEDE